MPLPVRTLPVAMIEPAFRTPLVAAVGGTALLPPGFACGKLGCNSAARDRSADKSRTPPGIPGRGKPAAGEPLRHEPPPEGGRGFEVSQKHAVSDVPEGTSAAPLDAKTSRSFYSPECESLGR